MELSGETDSERPDQTDGNGGSVNDRAKAGNTPSLVIPPRAKASPWEEDHEQAMR